MCGASFAGLTVARELAGHGARVLMVDRYEVGERQTSACAAPTEWLRAPRAGRLDPADVRRLVVHARDADVPLGAAVHVLHLRLPASCAQLLLDGCDARFETAKVDGRTGDVVHTDRGDLRAPLIVDALGWRRVLGDRERIQPPEARLSRGLEIHPHAAGPDLELWLDPRYVRAGYSWSFPADAELRVGVGSFDPRDHVASRPSASRPTVGVPAERWQGNWIPHQIRPATSDGVFFVGDSAGHCLPHDRRGHPPRVPLRARARPRAAGRARRASRSREQALERYAAFSDAHRWKYDALLRTQDAVGRLNPRPRGMRQALTAMSQPSLLTWMFRHYLNICPPEAAAAAAARARRLRSRGLRRGRVGPHPEDRPRLVRRGDRAPDLARQPRDALDELAVAHRELPRWYMTLSSSPVRTWRPRRARRGSSAAARARCRRRPRSRPAGSIPRMCATWASVAGAPPRTPRTNWKCSRSGSTPAATELERGLHVRGVEALDLRRDVVAGERRGHVLQERSAVLEDPVVEVRRPAVERAHLGRQVEALVALGAAKAPPPEPVLRFRTASQPRARMPSTSSAKRSLAYDGRPSSSRACRWMTDAPASHASTEDATISSLLIGTCGVTERSVIEPVTAAQMTTGAVLTRGSLSRGAFRPDRPASCSVPGMPGAWWSAKSGVIPALSRNGDAPSRGTSPVDCLALVWNVLGRRTARRCAPLARHGLSSTDRQEARQCRARTRSDRARFVLDRAKAEAALAAKRVVGGRETHDASTCCRCATAGRTSSTAR